MRTAIVASPETFSAIFMVPATIGSKQEVLASLNPGLGIDSYVVSTATVQFRPYRGTRVNADASKPHTPLRLRGPEDRYSPLCTDH